MDVRAVTDPSVAARSGVAHAEALLAFADALAGDDEGALDRARQELLAAVGPEGLVDTAAVASNFERMVRIADATGIPLDKPMQMLTEDVREELDLGRFASASNTPGAGAGRRAAASVLRPLAHGAIRLAGRVQRWRRPPR